MADFTTWQRSNLERLARELLADNQRLREEIRIMLQAWRAEVKATGKQQPHQPNGGHAR